MQTHNFMKKVKGIFRFTPVLQLSIIFSFASFTCFAQSDSLAVVNAKWERQKVAKGIQLKHFWFNHTLFGASQNINILEIKLNHCNKLDVAAEPKELKTASTFGKEHHALAALNGTFFDIKNGGSVDYIRLDEKELNATRFGKNNNRALHQKAAIVIRHRKVLIQQWDGTADWENNLRGEDIMVTGPMLLQKKEVVALDTTSFYKTRHPRTALAIKGKRIFLITVDGRNEKAAGMSLFELASIIKWLHADEAINLDGGGSTTLWIDGFPDGGVVNHPSDNKQMLQSKDYKPGVDLDNLEADRNKWDHGSERPVANVLLVNKKQ